MAVSAGREVAHGHARRRFTDPHHHGLAHGLGAKGRSCEVAGREVVEPDLGRVAGAVVGREQAAADGLGPGGGPPGLEGDRALAGTIADPLQRGDHVGRRHLGAAAALELGLVGPPPDHRDPPGRRVQRQHAVVGQQHDRLGGGGAGDVGCVGGRLQLATAAVHPRRGGAVDQVENPLRGPLDRVGRDLALLDGGGQVVAERVRRPRHLQVEPGGEGGRAVRAEPVGHHEPVEAPLAPQQVGEQAGVLAAVPAVDAVVGRHDRPDARPAHGSLEGRQVDLAPGALVDGDVDLHAVGLLVVEREVLDRAADPPALHALDERHGDLGRQVGVLGVALEVPAAERVAVDVHGGRQQHAGTLGPGLVAEQAADAADQRAVPRRRQGGTAGQRRRARARELRAPRPARPVGDADAGEAQPIDADRVPHVCAGRERRLLVGAQVGRRGNGAGPGAAGRGRRHVRWCLPSRVRGRVRWGALRGTR